MPENAAHTPSRLCALLADCRHVTDQLNIFAVRRFGGQLERNMNAIDHEMVCGATLHRD
jgi:hypothetical protein